ncbi:MAG TPA: hypothetical protein VGK73_04220 [Polyangiaceae bacterium]
MSPVKKCGVLSIALTLGYAMGCGSDEPGGGDPAAGNGGSTAGRTGTGGTGGTVEAGEGGEVHGGAGGSSGSGPRAGRGGTAGRGGNSGDAATGGDAGAGAASTTGGTSSSGGSNSGGSAGTSGNAGSGGEAPACPECNGPCTDSGECVECVESTHCTGELGHCDTETNTCVDCLPSEDDCGVGSFCDETFECVQGCSEAGDCASGVCRSDHTCQRCLADTECPAGAVCGSGTCSAACTDSEQCESGWSCCEGRCVDTTRDIEHCGGCGGVSSPNRCTLEDFCGAGACHEVSFANVCQTALFTAVDDGIAEDTQAATALAQALVDGCSPVPATRTVSQTATDILNPESGRPVVGGGETLLVAGGAYVQKVLGYLENQRIAPLFSRVSGDNFELARASDGGAIASIPMAGVDGRHDLLVIQLVRDPSSGTLVFSTFGFSGIGTQAAVYYFENSILPNPTSYPRKSYVFEWTDDGDDTPGAGDTFTPVSLE